MKLLEYSNAEFTIRTALLPDGSWCFIARDVCEHLGINDYRHTIERLDDDERVSVLAHTLGGTQQMTAVTESGLYALIFQSRKPEARRFRKWVTGEVLPAIRETGCYQIEEVDREREKELEAEAAGILKRLRANSRLRWKLNDVHGNVSFTAYIIAAGLDLDRPTVNRAAMLVGQRCKALREPVGKCRVRWRNADGIAPKGNASG